MKVNVLSILTVLSVLTLVSIGGFMYQKGYWHTWEDKKAEIQAEFDKQVAEAVERQGLDIPAEPLKAYTKCLTDGLVGIAVDFECPLDGMKPALPQLEDCLQSSPEAGLPAFMTLMQCAAALSEAAPKQ